MTSDQHGPYGLGDSRATMTSHKAKRRSNPEQIVKTRLSSDWGLQLAPMKLESLVTVNQPRYGEYVPGSCTHRPSSHGSQGRPKSSC